MTQVDASRLVAPGGSAPRPAGLAAQVLEAFGAGQGGAFAEIFASSISRRLADVRSPGGQGGSALVQHQPLSAKRAAQATRQRQAPTPEGPSRADRLKSVAREKAAERATERNDLRSDQAGGAARHTHSNSEAGARNNPRGNERGPSADSSQPVQSFDAAVMPEGVAGGFDDQSEVAQFVPFQQVPLAQPSGQSVHGIPAAPPAGVVAVPPGPASGAAEPPAGASGNSAAPPQHMWLQLPVQPSADLGGQNDAARGSARPVSAAEPHHSSARPAEAGGFQTALAGAARQRGAATVSHTAAGVLRNAAESVNLARPRSIDELAQVVRAQSSAGRSNMVLQLDPPELGRVRIDVRMQDQVLAVRFEATSEAGHQALRSRLGELQAVLEQQGVQLQKLEVELRPPPGDPQRQDGYRDGTSGSQSAPDGSPGSGRQDDQGAPAEGSSGILDGSAEAEAEAVEEGSAAPAPAVLEGVDLVV